MRIVMVMLLLVALAANGWAGEAPRPPYMQPDVLQAAVAINLTDEQKPQFQAALTEFFEDRRKMIAKLMRGNNVTNMDRKIKSRTNSLMKKMDKNVAGFLTAEQMPAYETYRDTLKSHMQG